MASAPECEKQELHLFSYVTSVGLVTSVWTTKLDHAIDYTGCAAITW